MPIEHMEHMTAALEALTASVEADRAAAAKEKLAEEERDKIRRRLLRWAIGVGLAGMVVGAGGLVVALVASNAAGTAQDAADVAQEAIDVVEESRAKAFIASCDTANDVAGKVNGLNDRTQQMLRDILSESSRPETVAFVEMQLAAFEAVKVRYRDCSPEGIDLYVESEGAEGFLPPGVAP